jgi:hypothetical protein
MSQHNIGNESIRNKYIIDKWSLILFIMDGFKCYYCDKSIALFYTNWQTQFYIFYSLDSSPRDFGEVRVAHFFSFLYCVVFLCFICPVSCVPNDASVFGLSILDCPFGFLYRLFNITTCIHVWKYFKPLLSIWNTA